MVLLPRDYLTLLCVFAIASGQCFNVSRSADAITVLATLRNLDRYCITLARILKHLDPAKCVITITYLEIFLNTMLMMHVFLYLR